MKPVLIVEDDRDAAEALRLILESAACPSVISRRGYHALEQYRALRPKLVFLDAALPDLSGCEVGQHIRSLDPNGETRIVFVTGASCPSPDYIERCAAIAQCDALVRKPYEPRQIVEHVRAVYGLAGQPEFET